MVNLQGDKFSFKGVKLNNPLMGTETEKELIMANTNKKQTVKLNNPLMGTETR